MVKGPAGWRIRFSSVVFGLAAVHVLVASAVASMLPPETSEGGVLAGAFYLVYYALPLTLLGLALRSRPRSIVALSGVMALGLIVLHSAPLLDRPLPLDEQAWQRTVALVLSALSALVESAVLIVAVTSVFAPGPRPHRFGVSQPSKVL